MPTVIADTSTLKIGDKYRITKDTSNSQFPIGTDVILVGDLLTTSALFSTGTELWSDWTEVPVSDGPMVRTVKWDDVVRTGDADPIWHPKVGDLLTVTNTGGYHGFSVGMVGKITQVSQEERAAHITDGSRGSWVRYGTSRYERVINAVPATPEAIHAWENPDFPDDFPRTVGALVMLKDENIAVRISDGRWRSFRSYGKYDVGFLTDAEVFRGLSHVMHHPDQPLPLVYNVGDEVVLQWNGDRGPNGESGRTFYMYGSDGPFVAGVTTATVTRVSGDSVRVRFPSGDTQNLTRAQVAPALPVPATTL